MEFVENGEVEQKLIEVSMPLRRYLNEQLLCKEQEMDEIYEQDIENMLNRFERINQVRTNHIFISAETAVEFLNLIKEEVKKRKLDLGLIEIDIAYKDFSIKNFVEQAKDVSYTLKVDISSLADIKQEEIKFLESRYGIIYNYADDEYHIDELFDTIKKLKELVHKNEKKIGTTEKNVERANRIADTIFKEFNLCIPSEYRLDKKEITLRNGQSLKIPNFRVLEDTRRYAIIMNIFSKGVADFVGMRKVCKECLRNDGFEMIERIATISNTVAPELIIEGIEYGIEVTADGINIVEV